MANIKIIRDANGNYSKKGGSNFGTTKPFIQNKTVPNEPGLDMDSVNTAPHRIRNRITNSSGSCIIKTISNYSQNHLIEKVNHIYLYFVILTEGWECRIE